MKEPLYFDHAAATPMDPRVRKAMTPYWTEQFYNPSSLYAPARKAKQALNKARADVAKVLGAKPTEIIFTAGATEANNLAIFGTATFRDRSALLTTTIEHESVLETMRYLHAYGWRTETVGVKPNGIVDPDKIRQAITDKISLVSVMFANNEIGTVQPIHKIAQLIQAVRADRQRRKIRRPLCFHTDASQAPNYLDLHVSRLRVDLMTLNGGKIYGPKQSGCLYVRSGTSIEPYIVGGGQERGLRSGTENVAANVGFAKALELTSKVRVMESRRLQSLRDYVIEQILQKIPKVNLNGDPKQRLPNNINLTIDGVSGESLVHHLDAAGILVATGSACSANNDRPSHVLAAISLNPTQVNSSLRITMGRSTTKSQVNRLISQLKQAVTKLRSMAS